MLDKPIKLIRRKVQHHEEHLKTKLAQIDQSKNATKLKINLKVDETAELMVEQLNSKARQNLDLLTKHIEKLEYLKLSEHETVMAMNVAETLNTRVDHDSSILEPSPEKSMLALPNFDIDSKLLEPLATGERRKRVRWM